MRKLALHWKIIIGLILGIIWAVLSSNFGWGNFTEGWIAPWGNIFINALKLIAVPLVLFSVIKGISGLTEGKLGKIGLKTIAIYILTTVTAVSIGLALVNIFKPGAQISEEQKIKNRITYELWAQETNTPIKDGKSILNDIKYSNYVAAATEVYEKEKEKAASDEKLQKILSTKEGQKGAGPLKFIEDLVPSNIFVSLSNNKLMLQVIFFALFFGITLMMIDKSKAQPVLDFVDGANEVFLKMVDLIMQAAPFFVFALMAGQLNKIALDNPGGITETLQTLGYYSLVVFIGLLFMVVLYPLLIKLIVPKIGFLNFLKGIRPAQLLAFSSSSSAATLPVTMECVNDNLKVPSKVSNFVLPIGATVNMDGTSLYQAVAAVFIAQAFGMDLTLGVQLGIIATATLASIGSAAVPGAGMVMLVIVLAQAGIPEAGLALIFAIDRPLDMCRTTVNVTGDAAVSMVVAKSVNKLE